MSIHSGDDRPLSDQYGRGGASQYNDYGSRYGKSEGGRSQRSRHGMSKTGGAVDLQVKEEDRCADPTFKPDDFNRIDLEVK